MKAVILAAGDGLRLRPLTETRPKPLLTAAGKPILHHLVSEAAKAGITEAVIVVRHMKEKIAGYVSNNDLGMKVTLVEQGAENGTGAALLAAQQHVDDTFLALAGDIVTDASVMRQVMEGHSGMLSVGLKKVRSTHGYGVAELSGDRISIFEEKPAHPRSDLANISVTCMEPTVFSELKSLGKSERGEYELVSLFTGAKGVVVEGYWSDIAYPWDLLDANAHILSRMEARSGHIDNSTVDGKVIMEKGAKVINSYIEGSAYIGAGTVIGPNACLRGSCSIGRNCSIGPGTTVKNSILLDCVNAKHLTYIGDSVIGEGVNFGSGTQIANYRFDSDNVNVLTEKGWVNSGRKKLGAFVGDNTKFGVLSCTMPGKLIGSGCEIHSGVVVNRNVPSGSRVYTRQPIEFGRVGDGKSEEG
jgi:UDP-N-acetylglucosamine diphosphorylase / glucose-1-phosphate thymidylyltransferase / UDP-N-acetylgalactosamine diphosphorylase / glucosamine-1-phosphate N-acetyltransferase / galactosamine-1-phosphate N-acetyltransferase